MALIKVFFSSGILGLLIAQATAFLPIILVLITSNFNLGESNVIFIFFLYLNLFAQALAEEWVKYYSAILWWRKGRRQISGKFFLYLVAGATGLAVFEKTVVVILKIGEGYPASILWLASLPLFFEAIILHSAFTAILYPFIKLAYAKNTQRYFYVGLTIASLVHAFYNYFLLRSASTL